MANTDSAAYNLRFNEVTQSFEYGVNGTWVAAPASAGSLPLTGGTLTGSLTQTKAPILNVDALPTSGTITPDGTLGPMYTIVVSGDTTIEGPSAPVDGQTVTLRILNDGSHTVTFDTGSGNFRFGTDIPSYTNSVSLTDYVGAIYNGPATVWDIVAINQGF